MIVARSVYSSAAIEAEHDRLGYTLGWRFLMCSEDRLRVQNY